MKTLHLLTVVVVFAIFYSCNSSLAATINNKAETPKIILIMKEGYYTIHSGKEHFFRWVPQNAYMDSFCDQSLIFHAMSGFFEPPSKRWHNPFIFNGEKVNGLLEAYKEESEEIQSRLNEL